MHYHRAVLLRNLPEAFCWNGFDGRRTKLKSEFAVKNIVLFSSAFQVTPGDRDMFVKWLVTFSSIFRNSNKQIFR